MPTFSDDVAAEDLTQEEQAYGVRCVAPLAVSSKGSVISYL